MPKIRILKRYREWHPKAGIEEADYVELPNADACARFVTKVNANESGDFEIVDYDVALIANMEAPEIITNPTGGGIGKLLPPSS